MKTKLKKCKTCCHVDKKIEAEPCSSCICVVKAKEEKELKRYIKNLFKINLVALVYLISTYIAEQIFPGYKITQDPVFGFLLVPIFLVACTNIVFFVMWLDEKGYVNFESNDP